jgi:hypothetical protein
MSTCCFDFFGIGPSREEFRPDHRQLHCSPDPSLSAAYATTGPLTSKAQTPSTTPPNSRLLLHPYISPLAAGSSYLFPVTQTCPFHLLLTEPSLVPASPIRLSYPFTDTPSSTSREWDGVTLFERNRFCMVSPSSSTLQQIQATTQPFDYMD